jgi:hypothetical protein
LWLKHIPVAVNKHPFFFFMNAIQIFVSQTPPFNPNFLRKKTHVVSGLPIFWSNIQQFEAGTATCFGQNLLVRQFPVV